MADLATKIKEDLLDAINRDTLVLPTLPEVALRVREVAENPRSSVQQLAATISNDAALSARIIRVCNSPVMRGSRTINDLNMAVSRLGMTYSANLATGLAMEQMFQATSDMIDRRMRESWQHSTEVAGICHVLAQHFTKLRPDQATLAGLVHQIGILPILTYIEEHDVQINNVILDNLIDDLAPRIGCRILEKWDFPEELRGLPEACLDFTRSIPQADYADVVIVAKLQSVAGSDHPYTKMDWTQISAFNRLGLDPDVDSTEATDLSEQMEAAAKLLQA